MNKDNYIHTPYNDEWIAQRADPYVYRHTDGTCYFTASVPAYDRIILRAAKNLDGLADAEEKTLWVKHESGQQSVHIWAPEIHYLFGGWYIYYAAGDKDDIWNIRPYVLHCKGEDPMKDEWEELGMMQAADEDEFSFRALQLHTTHTHTRLSSVASVPGILGRLLSGGRSLPAILVGNQSSAG